MLTTHLLTKNNSKTIIPCLTSIQTISSNIIIGDLGSTDDTIALCHDMGIKVIPIHFNNDYSETRNYLVGMSKTDWQLWIEPWEVMDSGHEQVLWAITQKDTAYKVYNVQNELISKQCRLWRKKERHFVRPVYESLEPEGNDVLLNCVIRGIPPKNFEETLKLINLWSKQHPHTADIDYYKACTYLTNGKYTEFLAAAEHFMFRNQTPSMAGLLTRYYYALVQLRNPEECIKHVIYCLTQEPTLAEFWCLLGDAFMRLKQFQRAIAFYDNALIFGSRRLHNDPYPIEVSKYHEYPTKMLAYCREVIKSIHQI